MSASWQIARDQLATRPARTVLLVAATGLASALVVSIACAITSAQRSMDLVVSRFIGAAHARIIHPGNGRFDAALLDQVRKWEEVKDATGRLGGILPVVNPARPRDPATGLVVRSTPHVTGVEFVEEPRFRAIELRSGRMPAGREEILIDPVCADELAAGPGDVLEVEALGGNVPLRVAGIYERPMLGPLQRPRITMDVGLLGELTERKGALTWIDIILEPGESAERFCARRSADLPESVLLEPAELVRSGFERRMRAARVALALLSVLAAVGSALIVVTGLTSGVTERERELALLRCLGGARRTLFEAQLLGGFAIGALGALTGIPLGLALAASVVAVFREWLPAGFVSNPAGFAIALATSIAAGLVGAAWPAVAASRVAPLAALSVVARVPKARTTAAILLAAALCFVPQAAAHALADPEERFWVHAFVAIPLGFVGSFLLCVPVLALIARALGPLLALALRLPRDLVVGSVVSTPIRHGLTAGALMIGQAILVEGWSTTTAALRDWIEPIRFADGFAYRLNGIPEKQIEAIESLPWVERTCRIGYLPLRIIGRPVFGLDGLVSQNVVCVGFDPERFFAINAVTWLEGEPAHAVPRLLDGSGIVVAEHFLTARGLGVGDHLALGVGERRARDFEIVGVVSSAGLDLVTQLFGIRSAYMEYAVSCVFMDRTIVAEAFGLDDTIMLQVDIAEEIDDAHAEAAVAAVAPGTAFRSGRWIARSIREVTSAVRSVETAMALIALVLAALAAGSVIAASIEGRRYEYGVIRAVGAPSGVLVRLVLAEAALLAATASIVGTLYGLDLAWIDATHLRELLGLPITVTLPMLPVLVGAALLSILALGAALPAALRIARTAPAILVAIGRNE